MSSLLALPLALGVLAAAGVSDLVGQCSVLLLNRVPPRRFLLCLASGLLLFLGSATLWSLSLWLFSWLLHWPLGLLNCLTLVGFAHAPLLLGFAVLIPHFGTYLQHALRGWVFLNLVVALGVLTDASLIVTVACCLPGWLLHFSLTHLELARLERFQAWLWRLLT